MPAYGQSEPNLDEAETYSDTLGGSSEDEEIACLLKCSNKFIPSNTTHHEQLATFESLPTLLDHEVFMKECLDVILKDAVFDGTNRRNKVLEFVQPEKLMQIFDFELKKTPSTHKELIKKVKNVIKYSVKTGHPYFVNQLFSSLDPYGLVGQILTDALNPSAYTYEVAPVIILMEETVLKEMRRIVGWPEGEGDGIFCPGGSMANGYAISCARHYYFPEIKTKGLHTLPKLVLFTSEDAHYSVKKFAAFLGLGTDNVHLVRTDRRGKMDPQHLEDLVMRCIETDGVKPFMVSATAGTTVIGAFDPLEQIADICKKYGMWLHVDAAWGGGALMSKKHRSKLHGIERADSVTWNPHKLLTAPQQCSTFLVRHRNVLSDAHSANAAYLFQKDKSYDIRFDTGDKHVQCGRKADVLKFWFMWNAKGTNGLEQHIDKIFDVSQYFYETIKSRHNFHIVIPEPECTNVCFWYLPDSLNTIKERLEDKLETDQDFWNKVHAVAPKIKEEMMKEGTMMVTYQTYKTKPNFFRIVFQNSSLNKNDMIHLIDEFERLGRYL